MDLIIDIGNSRSKLALFQDGELLEHAVRTSGDELGIDRFLGGEIPDASILSSVRKELPPELKEPSSFPPPLLLDHDTPIPIRLGSQDPRTLGSDRIANAVAAFRTWPEQPVLVIDMGTCITYDRIEEGELIGGAISPGVRMRAEAMHHFTGRLPRVTLEEASSPLGTDTDGSLRSGIYYGVLHEIKGWIDAFERDRKNGVVVLTGGDLSLVGKAFKKGIFADPFLTLRGLDAILHVHKESGTSSSTSSASD